MPRELDSRPAPTLLISRDRLSTRRGLEPQNICLKLFFEEILNSEAVNHIEVYFLRIQNAFRKYL